jgi:hypothetical protein
MPDIPPQHAPDIFPTTGALDRPHNRNSIERATDGVEASGSREEDDIRLGSSCFW